MLPDAPPPADDAPPPADNHPADHAAVTPGEADSTGSGPGAEGESGALAGFGPTSPISAQDVPTSGTRPRRGARGTLLLGIAAALVLVLTGSALFAAGYALGGRQASQPGTPAADVAAFQPFWDVYAAIRDRFALGPVDQKTLVDGAIQGMVGAIGDPFSSYLTPDQYRSTLQGISGEFEGIGAEIGTVDAKGATVDCATFGANCRLGIVAPLQGSPAEKAGLKPGDVITAVDGTTIDGLTISQARDKIRGKKGTTVVLTIERTGRAPFDVTITRDIVQQQEVITKDLASGTIAYIRLTGFSDTGASAFVKAVQAALDKGETRIIVDLRGNPGGFVTAARTVASTFIAKGPVFWEEDAQGNLTSTDSLGNGIATDAKIHVAVLIDKGSASASEIVAGALQDTGRGTLIGETSYGKGTVQTWIELANNTGAVKLTVAKWLTPNKRWIHKIGLTPDIPVTVPANTPAGSDPVLDRAISFLSGSGALSSVLPHAA